MTDNTESETTGQRRLREARQALADQRAAQAGSPEAEAPAIRYVQPGTTVHALRSGLTVDLGGERGTSGVVLNRGDQFTITAAMLERTRNRLGELTGVALAADEDAQIRKYGEVRFRVGETPADLRPWRYGDPAWSRARESARRAAWEQPTDAARADALAELERIYGPAAATSVTTNSAPNKSIAEAAVQSERLAARAAQGTR